MSFTLDFTGMYDGQRREFYLKLKDYKIENWKFVVLMKYLLYLQGSTV